MAELGPDTGIVPGIGGANQKLVPLSSTPVTAAPASAAAACADPVFRVINQACTNDYYLGTANAPKFGYYLNFANAANGFIPKGIVTPIVVSGSLFYSVFTPTESDPCTGGTGVSVSYRITDVMNPIVDDRRSGIGSLSGAIGYWSGVTSDFFAVGTTAVMQGGTVAVANPTPGGSKTQLMIQTAMTSNSARFPKARVWRTVR